MKKMTKIGLTELAGSLVATSAFAGSMSVSGSAKVTTSLKVKKDQLETLSVIQKESILLVQVN